MARAQLLAALAVTVLTVQAYVMPPLMSPRTSESVLGNSPNKTACGDNLCRCSGDYADCSVHHGGLHYIPRLPNSIRVLNFSHNQLKLISQDDFFQNVTHLTSLDLSNNGLRYISPVALRNLTQLQLLDMNNNAVNKSSLSVVLTVSTLTRLSLSGCRLKSLPDELFDDATLPKLSTLDLYFNNLGEWHSTSRLLTLTGLKRLDLSGNQITSLTVDHDSDLEMLNMESNDLIQFPTTCNKTNYPFFPKLIKLSLADNNIYSVSGAYLPKVKILDLFGNRFTHLPKNAFGLFPSLILLRMGGMSKSHINTVEAYAFSSRSLQRISLYNNNMDFKNEYIANKCFAKCPNLKDLQLSHNYLDISEERFLRLFGHLTQMKYLFMEACHISVLTPRMFAGLLRLEKLALDRNRLSGIPDGTFDGLRKLSILTLDRNQISVVPPTLFNADTRRRLTSLDLGGNPFTCSCDVLWFRSWYLADPSLFASSWGSFNCFNIPGVDIGSFYLPSQACLLSRSAAVMVIANVSLVLLVLALVVTVFRYRWHFRLLLHEAFRGNGETRRRRLETGRFQYDLFVSYDSDNLPWVLQHLVPQLEERRGLRLCLHQRDFIPGRNIVDNIADCVDSSKKVLMLFSVSFVRSQWCQFELALCLRHVMDYDDALVIVCLDDVPSRDLTTAMIAVLKTTTYIQWVDDNNDAMTSFWDRLDVALQEILPRRDVRVPIEGHQFIVE